MKAELRAANEIAGKFQPPERNAARLETRRDILLLLLTFHLARH